MVSGDPVLRGSNSFGRHQCGRCWPLDWFGLRKDQGRFSEAGCERMSRGEARRWPEPQAWAGRRARPSAAALCSRLARFPNFLKNQNEFVQFI